MEGVGLVALLNSMDNRLCATSTEDVRTSDFTNCLNFPIYETGFDEQGRMFHREKKMGDRVTVKAYGKDFTGEVTDVRVDSNFGVFGSGGSTTTITMKEVTVKDNSAAKSEKPLSKQMQYTLKIAGQHIKTTYDLKEAEKLHLALVRLSRTAHKFGAKFPVAFDAVPMEVNV